MPTKRQKRFLAAVVEAARAQRPRGGRPTPESLTPQGRVLGLAAAHASPRCQATRRNGQPCRGAALRGARRCIAHGGRVEVPGHPHNLRRWLIGEMERAFSRHDEVVEGRRLLAAMSIPERRSTVADLPLAIRGNEVLIARATAILHGTAPMPFTARRARWQRFLVEFEKSGPL